MATALKAFPGLLIVYFAYRRAWRTLTAAIVTAAALSVAPVFVYGPAAFVAQARQWLAFSTGGGWTAVGDNQSLTAMIQRVMGPADPRLLQVVYLAGAVALLALFVGTTSGNRPTDEKDTVLDMAVVTLIAVVVSPIAWDHYWVLLFPAFFAVFNSRLYRADRWVVALFWVALVLTSGFSRTTAGQAGFAYARHASTSTWAALMLFGMLLAVRRDRATREPPVEGALFRSAARRG